MKKDKTQVLQSRMFIHNLFRTVYQDQMCYVQETSELITITKAGFVIKLLGSAPNVEQQRNTVQDLSF